MKKWLPFITIPGGVTILVAIIIFQLFIEPIYLVDAKFYDYFVRSRTNAMNSEDVFSEIEDIAIINIDSRSTQKDKLGKFSRWPLSTHAKLIDRLAADSAAVIVFDIIFDADEDTAETNALLRSVERAGNVINAISFMNPDEIQFITANDRVAPSYNYEKDSYSFNYEFLTKNRYPVMDTAFIDLLNASKRNGSVTIQPDGDGVNRSYTPFTNYLGRYYPLIGLQAFALLNQVDEYRMGEDNQSLDLLRDGQLLQNVPLDNGGNIPITYYGGMRKFRVVPYFQAIDTNIVYPGTFRDRIVFIGTDLPGLFDLRATPLAPITPGVALHTNLLWTLMQQEYVTRTTPMTLTLIMFVLAFITVIIVHRLSLLWAILSTLVGLLLYFLVADIIFEAQMYYLPQFPVMMASVFSLIGMYAYKYNTEEKDKRMIRSTFSRFVNKEVVDELLEDPSKLKLGGVKTDLTVFFSDVAGFTSISEAMDPEQLVHLLNQYLTEMTNIVFQNGGMIDKYIGDAIMAIHGAPVAHGNHAVQGCRSALQQQQRLAILREELVKQGYPPLIARMGLNTGKMVVGNMGSQEYFNYTVMGDAVNLAARLEPANKDYDTLIMIGQNTYEAAKEEIYARQLDLMVVKGKTEPVKVYELMGMTDMPFSDDQKRLVDRFRDGYKMYLERYWTGAIDQFEQALEIVPDDGPSKLYIERCQHYLEVPPADDWTGVYMKTSK